MSVPDLSETERRFSCCIDDAFKPSYVHIIIVVMNKDYSNATRAPDDDEMELIIEDGFLFFVYFYFFIFYFIIIFFWQLLLFVFMYFNKYKI